MKYILIILLLSSLSYGQTLKTCTIPNSIEWHVKGTTATERNIWTEIAVIGLTLSDVILYKAVEGTKYVDAYRTFQGLLQGTISYILLKTMGLSSLIGFNVQLLFSTNDLLYYGFYPSEFQGEFNHLGLNPIYLMNGNRISKNDIKWGVGFSIAISTFLNVVKNGKCKEL